MSDDENSQEEVKKEIPEPPGLKFFLSHMNSYTGKALLEELKNSHLVKDPAAAHTFIGTLYKDSSYDFSHPDITPDGVEKLVSMARTEEFRHHIIDSDVIIYDLLTNSYEEVDYVIKALKASKLEKEKTLILLSTVMTWVNTPPKYKKEVEGGEEEENAE
jgi:hypothetical protein